MQKKNRGQETQCQGIVVTGDCCVTWDCWVTWDCCVTVFNLITLENSTLIKDGAYYCYCAYVLRISRYSDFLSPMLTNTGTFLRGLKLSGESRS